LPVGGIILSISAGLDNPEVRYVTPEQVTSLPLRAIITGSGRGQDLALRRGAHEGERFHGDMQRADIATDRSRVGNRRSSREYANISLKFGYHFIILNCFCSENTRNNHIYFRFAGGATDMTKRSRRLELIAAILGEYGFNIKTKGDLIVARLANIRQQEAEDLSTGSAGSFLHPAARCRAQRRPRNRAVRAVVS
jgi:pyruvate,water dikinase